MLIRFYASEGKEREEGLAQALRDGAEQFDDRVEIVPTHGFKEADPSVDVACAFGVKGHTKSILDAYLAAGRRTVMFDKALVRSPRVPLGYHRVCLDGTTPMKTMMRRLRTWERWERLGVKLQKRRPVTTDGAIVFAGSSQKYCAMHGLGDATDYARDVFAAVRRVVRKRPLIYRPKPSWNDFRPIRGTLLSRGEPFDALLPRTHVVVTHGSSAAIDAIIGGVPAIALGECAATPVAGTTIEDVRDPPFVGMEARWHWACQLAWCQWHLSEVESGAMWAFMRKEIEETA